MLPTIEKILYATDLKDMEANNAFRFAVSLAKTHNAQLVVLHVMETLSSAMEGMLRNAMSESDLKEFKQQGLEHLKENLKLRLQDYCRQECPDNHEFPTGEPVIVIGVGEADESILNQAKDHGVDLIIMGTRTHTGIGQLLLGSTANKVIHHSKIPVVVYPL
jgi:nucleotide-binding universal stress UspA family protein